MVTDGPSRTPNIHRCTLDDKIALYSSYVSPGKDKQPGHSEYYFTLSSVRSLVVA